VLFFLPPPDSSNSESLRSAMEVTVGSPTDTNVSYETSSDMERQQSANEFDRFLTRRTERLYAMAARANRSSTNNAHNHNNSNDAASSPMLIAAQPRRVAGRLERLLTRDPRSSVVVDLPSPTPSLPRWHDEADVQMSTNSPTRLQAFDTAMTRTSLVSVEDMPDSTNRTFATLALPRRAGESILRRSLSLHRELNALANLSSDQPSTSSSSSSRISDPFIYPALMDIERTGFDQFLDS